MNKNIIMVARLYDSFANDLHTILASEKITLNDPRIVDKIKLLGEIARTFSAVYQLESMRAKPTTKDGKDVKEALPLPEEKIIEDPALKKSQKGQQFKPNNTPNDLSGFRSPGGWVP